MTYGRAAIVLLLCIGMTTALEARGRFERRLPRHLMRVPSTTENPLVGFVKEEGKLAELERPDCDAMVQCNLTEAVPSGNLRFAELKSDEKIEICKKLKHSTDCSSLFTCGRMKKLTDNSNRFFEALCKNLFIQNGLAIENCYAQQHKSSYSACSTHLDKANVIANEANPSNNTIREACCALPAFKKCYQEKIMQNCAGPHPSEIPVQLSPEAQRLCINHNISSCRSQRESPSQNNQESWKSESSTASSLTVVSSLFVVLSSVIVVKLATGHY